MSRAQTLEGQLTAVAAELAGDELAIVAAVIRQAHLDATAGDQAATAWLAWVRSGQPGPAPDLALVDCLNERPLRPWPAWADLVLSQLEAGQRITAAARAAGITHPAIHGLADRCDVFAARLAEARQRRSAAK